eukprot:Rmarinus@m.12877
MTARAPVRISLLPGFMQPSLPLVAVILILVRAFLTMMSYQERAYNPAELLEPNADITAIPTIHFQGETFARLQSAKESNALVVISVIGTRPEAVKLAPVLWELKKRESRDNLLSLLLFTGQHVDMIKPFLDIFDLEIDLSFDIMSPNQPLADLNGKAMVMMDRVLETVEPHLVLVQGDTTSAMAAGVASFYRNVMVGHVEAGLRTYDMLHPFPEEFDRQCLAILSNLHFAPTSLAGDRLRLEGVPQENIFVTGNTVIDTMKWITKQPVSATVKTYFDEVGLSDVLSSARTSPHEKAYNRVRIVLLTAHRRENHGDGLEAIFSAVIRIAREYPDVHFVFPVHPNPHVREQVDVLRKNKQVHMLDPLSYEQLSYLLSKTYMVMTDSGGLQEESTVLSRPVLVLRESTERMEGVIAGVASLVGTDTERIVAEARKLLDIPEVYESMSRAAFPYGDGTAASQIVNVVIKNAAKLMLGTVPYGAADRMRIQETTAELSGSTKLDDASMVSKRYPGQVFSIHDLLPACEYAPSYIVHSVKKFQGPSLVRESEVYPDDRTNDFPSLYKNKKGNKVMSLDEVERTAFKYVDALNHRLPSHLSIAYKAVNQLYKKVDEEKGERYYVDLTVTHKEYGVELGTSQISGYSYLPIDATSMCRPQGVVPNLNASIYVVVGHRGLPMWGKRFIDNIKRIRDQSGDNLITPVLVDYDYVNPTFDLKAYMESLDMPHLYVPIDGPFTRTGSLNLGAEKIPDPKAIIFMCDLHLEIPHLLFDYVRRHTIEGTQAFAPMVVRLQPGRTPHDPEGGWENAGYGLFAMYMSDFKKVGEYNSDEFNVHRGGEDIDLLDRVLRAGYEVDRLRVPGFYHFYHTQEGLWEDTNNNAAMPPSW